MRAREFITELFDPATAFELEWDETFAPDELHALAYDRQGRIINISFVPISGDAVDIEFTRGGSHDITGRGDAERVFATVLQAIQVYLARYRRPEFVLFSGKETSRNRLYQSLVARYAAKFGYHQITKDQMSDELKSMTLPDDVFALSRAQAVAEAFDRPYPHEIQQKSEFGDYDTLVRLPDGNYLSIMFNNEGNDEWQVEFYRNNSQEVTGEGDAQRIFATVLNAIQKFIKAHEPWRLVFSAKKDVDPGQKSESRAKLYDRLVQRYATAWGYESYAEDHGDQVVYELTRFKPGVAEGKVKLYTDPDYFGAEVDDAGFDSLPVVDLPTNQLVGFEPNSKMQEPKAKANVKKILLGLKKGDSIPPILVRKYKTGYQVLDGHHRFWAYKVAKKDTIPARVVDPKDIEEVGRQGVSEGVDNIVAVIDGVRSDRQYNDVDHAHNSLGKLVAYGRAKVAELYVNGEKYEHFEIGKKYREFEPKSLDQGVAEKR